MARKTAKTNNAPLLVLLAGLIAVAILLTVYGVVKNRGGDGPASVPDTTNASADTGNVTLRTSEALPSSTVMISGTDTTSGTIEVIATASLDTEPSGSSADTTKQKQTTTTVKKTTTTSAKTVTTATEAPAGEKKYSSVPYYRSKYADRYEAYGKKNPKYTAEQIVTFVNIGLDKKYYTDTKTAINMDTRYILANKYYYMPKDYVPANLKRLPDEYLGKGNTGKYLVDEAADAFVKLSDAAREKGLSILARSGYRDYDFQDAIYNNMVKIYGQSEADTFSARPGYSEHQTGYAVDVCTKTVPYDQFETTEEYKWAKENIHKYGFVIHYTKENEWITGYMDEAWHFRYIGVKEATEIYSSGLSVDEYIIRYHDK